MFYYIYPLSLDPFPTLSLKKEGEEERNRDFVEKQYQNHILILKGHFIKELKNTLDWLCGTNLLLITTTLDQNQWSQLNCTV